MEPHEDGSCSYKYEEQRETVEKKKIGLSIVSRHGMTALSIYNYVIAIRP